MSQLITALIANGPQAGEVITVEASDDGSAPPEILLPTPLQLGVNVRLGQSGATRPLPPTVYVLSSLDAGGQPCYSVRVN
jgi:hypothetical protein